MQEVLEIILQKDSEHTELALKGRLDSFGSRTLEDELQNQMKESSYRIVLNFNGVIFLSSAGIRVLIKYFKELKGIGGFLKFIHLPDKINEVVKLAGLQSLFSSDSKREEKKTTQLDKPKLESERGIFQFIKSDKKEMTIRVSGDPNLINEGGYKEENSTTEVFDGSKYALGLGAIGENFEDCKERFGEYLAVSNAAIYLPTDGTKSADYILRSNKLLPKVSSLYSIVMEGEFGYFLNFDCKEGEQDIPLSEIVTTLFENQNCKALSFVMLAETSGLCGCSLNVSPINENNTNPFLFPSIKENINFTTEPEYSGCLTLTTGIINRDIEELESYTKPLLGTDLHAHFHTAVFDFMAIQRNDFDLDRVVEKLLEGSRLKGLLHLLDDDRPHDGIGESTFKRGACWISPVNNVLNTTN